MTDQVLGDVEHVPDVRIAPESAPVPGEVRRVGLTFGTKRRGTVMCYSFVVSVSTWCTNFPSQSHIPDISNAPLHGLQCESDDSLFVLKSKNAANYKYYSFFKCNTVVRA